MSDRGPLKYSHTNVSVGSSTTVLAAANPNRKWLLIQNRSDEAVDIKIGASAVSGEGIKLAADGNPGSAFEMSFGIGNMNNEIINGICASGSKTVTVNEAEEDV